MKRLSIIVPCYNAQETVKRAVGSVSFRDPSLVELILVNDASKDRTGVVVEELSQGDPRVKVVNHPENRGVHEARRTGLLASEGEVIGFLDADDVALPGAYEKMRDQLLRTKADIVISGISMERSAANLFSGRKLRFRNNRTLSQGCFESFCRMKLGTGVLWNKLFTREVIEEPQSKQFPTRLDFNEDYLVNIGAFLRAKSVSLMRDVLFRYVNQEGSATRSTSSHAKRRAQLLLSYATALELYQAERPDAQGLLTELYKRQIAFRCYQISSPDEMGECQDLYTEACRRIAALHPSGLAELEAVTARRDLSWLKDKLVTTLWGS